MPCRKKKGCPSLQAKRSRFSTLSCVSACLLYDGGSHRFLTEREKDEVKEVSAVVTEEPKVNTGYAAMKTNPLLENRDEELADAVEAYYQELSGKEAYAEAYDGIAIYTKDGKAKGSRILYVRYNMKTVEFTLKYRDLKPYMRSRTKMENSIFRQRSLTRRFRR